MPGRNKYRKSSAKKAKSFKGLWGRILSLGLIPVAFLGLSLLLVWGYDWITSSEHFALRRIQVQGGRHLDQETILDIAGISQGQNVLGISLAQVESRLRQEPWVEKVRVQRTLPDKLLIQVQEKEARFWILQQAELYYADSQGSPITKVQAQDFVSLPLLLWDGQDERQQSHLDLIRDWLQQKRLPFSLAEVAWIRFASAEVVELGLQERDLLLRVGTEYLQQNLASLGRVWRRLQEGQKLEGAKRFVTFEGLCWVKFQTSQAQD
ncbi:MAG: cell division protein FtsQ/DivIB [Thermodesulfobacteriota bacterium]